MCGLLLGWWECSRARQWLHEKVLDVSSGIFSVIYILPQKVFLKIKRGKNSGICGHYPKSKFTPPSQREVHTFVRTVLLNSASIKNWPSSAWVGLTDPKAWAVQLAWPLGRGDMRSSTFWKVDNSWSRETENKGKALSLWECDPFCQQGWLVGQVLCLLCSVSSEKHTTVPYTSTEFRGIQVWS